MAKQTYPEWKVLAWRGGRTFLATFLVLLGSGIATASPETTVNALLVSAMAGALSAMGKLIRVSVSDSYDHDVHKLPF